MCLGHVEWAVSPIGSGAVGSVPLRAGPRRAWASDDPTAALGRHDLVGEREAKPARRIRRAPPCAPPSHDSLAAGALTVAEAAPAFASNASPSVSFSVGGNGTAGWVSAADADADGFAIQLSVPDTASYADAELHPVPAALPSVAPTFEYQETGTFSSGSPRLVIQSANCTATEYSLSPSATDWVTASQWDVYGHCGYGYNVGWSGVVAAFGSAGVTSVAVQDDSYTGGHTDLIDNIVYGSATITQPGNH